jgi:hypothetical protein
MSDLIKLLNQKLLKHPERKLILHFDQHNTIQVACLLPGRSLTVEEGLNNFLTSAVWGKVENNEWIWISNEPQLHKPINEPDAITYFKYLEKILVKKPEDRVEFKKKTCNFVYEEPGKKFKEFFDLYLQSLTSKILNSDANPCNTIPSGDPNNKTLYNLILPEFFDMIRRLQKQKREFTIILRTMGIDSQGFLDTVCPIFEGKHESFKDIQPITINRNIGRIKRSENDKIQLEIDGEIFEDDASIYKKLNSLNGINAIRDDFDYWQRNNYECYSAKPLWIDLEDLDHQHILFDDNIRLDEYDDCIVNVRMKNIKKNIYENIDFDCYNIFEKCSILQPNLLELLNPHLKIDSTKNHYCEKIAKAENIYQKMLDKKDSYNIRIKSFEEEIILPKLDIINNDKNILHKSDVVDNDFNFMFSKRNRKSVLLINNSLTIEIEEEENKFNKKNKLTSNICTLQ